MIKFKISISSFLISLSLFGVACQAEQPANKAPNLISNSLLGTWQVTSVLTDQGIKGEIQGLDDKYLIPKYHGRILTLTPTQVSINTPRDEVCEEPELIAHQSTITKLIANSISTRFQNGTSPTAKDMKLPLDDAAAVDVLYLTCKGKLRAKDEGMTAQADLSNVVWFIDLGNKQFAMSWHDQTILILDRVHKNAKPVASFNCAKAGTDVEKTICGSVGLAAYDVSLAQSYNLVKSYYKSKPDNKPVLAELKASQREWISQRNRCGADEKCLEKVMNIRIGDLIYDLGDYMYQNR